MNEKEIIDESLLENIEGLLFSEEYADSEGNSSLISEIANAEIPAEDNSDGNGEGAKESDASKSNSQNNNVKENVLSIDYSEDNFEKGFDSFAIERLRDSIRANKGVRRLFVEKNSVKDGLTPNFPIWAYGESEHFSLTSFMKDGFGAESLRDPVGTGRESVKPVVSEEKSKVSVENIKVTEPLANQEKPKTLTRGALRFENTNNSAEDGKEQKFNLINTEVPKVSRDPEKKNVFAEAERPKAPVRDALHVEKSNKPVEKDNGLKFDPVNTEVPKASRDPEKKNVFAEAERPKAPARDLLHVEKSNKPVEKDNGLKFDSVNTEVPKVSKDPEKKNVFAEAERPKAPARDLLHVEKSNKPVEKDNGLKFDSVNTEVPKVSKDSEKKNVFAEAEWPKAPVRDILHVEKSNKPVEKDNGLKFDSVNTEVPKVSKDPEKKNVFAEAERPKALARGLLSIEKSNKMVENGKEIKDSPINKEISKVSSVEMERPEISAKPEKEKPAPKKDFAEFKNDYKNIAANNAISITGDKSLSFTSSCSQKQDEMFLDTNEKAKRNSFDNQSFNGFRKDILRYTIPQRTSCFSLTGRSSTKMNFDNAIEKKSRMSMFNERKSSAYNCMKNDFKHKKELF